MLGHYESTDSTIVMLEKPDEIKRIRNSKSRALFYIKKHARIRKAGTHETGRHTALEEKPTSRIYNRRAHKWGLTNGTESKRQEKLFLNPFSDLISRAPLLFNRLIFARPNHPSLTFKAKAPSIHPPSKITAVQRNRLPTRYLERVHQLRGQAKGS